MVLSLAILAITAVEGMTPWGLEPDTTPCPCIGYNWFIPRKYKRFAGTDYGTKCAAWDAEYKYCGDAKRKADANRDCWCKAKWCFVGADCVSGVETTLFEDAEDQIWYSYASCGDSKAVNCLYADNKIAEVASMRNLKDALYATNTRDSPEEQFVPLGSSMQQHWEDCHIVSCMFFPRSVEGRRRRSEGVAHWVELSNPTMSSVGGNTKADYAIDGKSWSTNFNDRSCIHTQNGANWWKAEFDGVFRVDTVRIFERFDCCWWRLQGVKIEIGNEVCVAKVGANGYRVKSELNVLTCENGGATGSFIKISSPEGAEPLNFCEVEVYGAYISGGSSAANEEAAAPIVETSEGRAARFCELRKITQGDNYYYGVLVQPYTVAYTRCTREEAFKSIHWLDKDDDIFS